MINNNNVAHAEVILRGVPPDLRDELRDIIRRLIADKSSVEADAAIVELFAEIQILDDVIMESYGYVRCANADPDADLPF